MLMSHALLEKNGCLSPEHVHARVKELVFDALTETAPVAFYWMDRDGYFLGCSEKELEILKLSSQNDLIGKHSNEIADPSAWQNSQQAMEKNQVLTIEESFTDANQNTFYFLSIKCPLQEADGKVVGLLGISIDITDRKKMEDELRAAKKKAESLYHSKMEFISIASHEVRGPVGISIAMVDSVSENVKALKKFFYQEVVDVLDAAGKRDLVKTIHDQLDATLNEAHLAKAQARRSLNALVNLGNLHRLQEEGVRASPEQTDILSMFSSIIEESEKTNDMKIEVILDIAPDVPKSAFFDYRNVLEALSVVLNNAIRFSFAGSIVKLNVSITKKNTQDYLVVTIQDYGAGIPEAQIPYLFNALLPPEEQTQETRYRKPSLQLPQVKMKLEASGGDIHVQQSVLDKGTIMTASIPITLQENAWLNNNEDNKPRYVLLVEDDPACSAIEKKYLEEAGHRVDVASTAAAAISLATTNKYDLILLDITLPDMNGITAIQKIRQKTGDSVPFVAVTSHAGGEDEDYFLSEGSVIVLAKPVSKQELQNCVISVIAAKAHENDEDDVEN